MIGLFFGDLMILDTCQFLHQIHCFLVFEIKATHLIPLGHVTPFKKGGSKQRNWPTISGISSHPAREAKMIDSKKESQGRRYLPHGERLLSTRSVATCCCGRNLPGSDGHVRQVTIRTANQSRFRRDVRKLCLLEKSD